MTKRPHIGHKIALVMSAVAGAGLLTPVEASCQPTLTVIHTFTGGSMSQDGYGPRGGIGFAGGAIFGTTFTGGRSHTPGTAYAITLAGQVKFSKLLSQKTGYAPLNGIQQAGDLFYATANSGGPHSSTCVGGCGTIFSITERGNLKSVYNFQNDVPGSPPINIGGTLYGVTENGGAYNTGAFYSISSTGVYTNLHSFGNGTDGMDPVGLINVGGVFYGVAVEGGTFNEGAAYSITASGVETILYNFGSAPGDALYPSTALAYANGVLYGVSGYGGTTQCKGVPGCGTIFSLSLSGAETVLHSFTAAYGQLPSQAVLPVGNLLYGVAFGGKNQVGFIYSMTQQGKFNDLYDFAADESQGYDPSSPLLDVNGTLYGTAQSGGPEKAGTLFAFTP
jgi:uncharacterized repeat protein (TIGR03803 family)